MNIKDLETEFQEIKIERDNLKKAIDQGLEDILDLKASVENLIKARWVLNEVAQITQKRFKSYVEPLVTMAIQSVFSRPFRFELEFEQKRNKMECLTVIKETVNGRESIYNDPENDMGGGALDIISFALRVVLWSLEEPRSRAIIILDEPMKNLGKFIILGGQVLREISKKLGIQLVIVTHEDELLDIADKSFRVTHNGTHSLITSEGDPPKEIKTKIRRRNLA